MDVLNKVTYRRSTRTDAEDVFNLITASISNLAPDPYPFEVVATWMAGRSANDYSEDCENKVIWIAEIDQKPVGFSHGVPGEVKRLFVDVKHVGKRIGAELMKRALADARGFGPQSVKIDATLNAVPFYKKWGFKEVGENVFPGRDGSLPAIAVVILEAKFDER